jgi:hypothetical protein
MPVFPLDFGQLRAFVAVAEALDFSRAAEKLGVSSSALSQMVRGLIMDRALIVSVPINRRTAPWLIKCMRTCARWGL